MTAIMDSTNERLSNIFDTLVGRLDSIETKQDMLDAKQRSLEGRQDLVEAAVRHANSLRPLMTPFSGLSLTGTPVILTTDAPFNMDGTFHNTNGLLVACIYGNLRYRPISLTNGADPEGLYKRFPQLLAVAPSCQSFAFSVCDIKTISTIMDEISDQLHTTRHSQLEIYVVSDEHAELALAIVRGTGIRHAWEGLSFGNQNSLKNRAASFACSFFTQDRLSTILDCEDREYCECGLLGTRRRC